MPVWTLYFGYGANTNIACMAKRCPAAKPLGRALLLDYQLEFRTYADIRAQTTSWVWGATWQITPTCEQALDYFEEHPEIYLKHQLPVQFEDGRWAQALVYSMCDRFQLAPPVHRYWRILEEGYRDFDLPQQQLQDAIDRLQRARMSSLQGRRGED